MKSHLLSLAALCCTPLFAQHPTETELSITSTPRHLQEAPMRTRTVMDDGTMLLCDSTLTYDGPSQDLPRSKTEYTYDAFGNTTSIVFYSLRNGMWVAYSKSEYTYDANGNQTSVVSYNWQDGVWAAYDKQEYTYDVYGNQTSEAYYDKRYNGAWVGSYKFEYTYDTYGNKTSQVYYSWQDGTWVVNHKYEYIYDANGHQTSVVYYDKWYYDSWVGSWKYEYTYDAYGNLSSKEKYNWRNGTWILDYKILYFYSLHNIESLDQISFDTPSQAPRKQLLPEGRIVINRDGRSYDLGGQMMK